MQNQLHNGRRINQESRGKYGFGSTLRQRTNVQVTLRVHDHWSLTNRANTTSKFVKRQSQYFGTGTIKIIYQLLVRSILKFSALIWLPNHMVPRNSIESVQKQMVLFLLGDNKRHLTGIS